MLIAHHSFPLVAYCASFSFICPSLFSFVPHSFHAPLSLFHLRFTACSTTCSASSPSSALPLRFPFFFSLSFICIVAMRCAWPTRSCSARERVRARTRVRVRVHISSATTSAPASNNKRWEIITKRSKNCCKYKQRSSSDYPQSTSWTLQSHKFGNPLDSATGKGN